MALVEVAVDFPAEPGRVFTYSSPGGLSLGVGQPVWVPFGRRSLAGVVVSLEANPVEGVREVLLPLYPQPLLSPPQVELARWLSHRYFSPLYPSLSLMLPPGWNPLPIIALEPGPEEGEVPNLSEPEERVLRMVRRRATLAGVERVLGKKQAREVVEGLQEKRLVTLSPRPPGLRGGRPRAPLASQGGSGPPQPAPPLTPAQQSALAPIQEAIDRGQGGAFLLLGVTGSGKTEIYLHALAMAMARGQRGLVLVPEISLTPQTIERFSARFPGQVAVLHSRLRPTQQQGLWWAARRGEFRAIVGPRSALFAPQPDLGLIVVDEEHDPSYKGMEHPRYHTREVALRLASLNRAVVILGSATPDVETFYRARRGEFQLLELPERIAPAALPQVEVVDLRQELKAGAAGPFSRPLSQGLAGALKGGEKAILFLNRRGAANLVRCRGCGTVMECRRCAVALVYHRSPPGLLCHQCGYRAPVPRQCPRCHRPMLSFLGTGTQRVEDEVRELFPQARSLRYDLDVARGGEEVLQRFASGEGDVLIGTQMVAKGLDFPQVTLVGVVSADTALPFPDFRSGERTFQLLCQVAGRAGRGEKPGRVIVQTYRPDHYAIQAAARQDYRAFYEEEIAYRRAWDYPPFSRLVRLVYSHTNLYRCREGAEKLKEQLLAQRSGGDTQLLGPSPCFLSRLRGRFRWQLLLKGPDPAALLPPHLPPGWVVDVDPVNLL